MTKFTEGLHRAESLVSMASGERALETVTIASGNTLTPCQVLGKITATGEFAPLDPAASDGTETAAAISYTECIAADAAAECVVFVRDCEHAEESLTFPDGITAPQKAAAIAQLEAAGIILR